MPPALGPRFVLEAGFLVLLAVVVGFAELDAWLIILVMAAGWALVSLIEYYAWRQSVAYATGGRYVAPAEPAIMHEEVVEDISPPPPPPPPPAEEATMVAPEAEPPEAAEVQEETPSEELPAAEAEVHAVEAETKPAEAETTPAEAEEPKEFRAEPEKAPHRLEPLQPRPRRRWVLFGSRERPPAPGDGGRVEEE